MTQKLCIVLAAVLLLAACEDSLLSSDSTVIEDDNDENGEMDYSHLGSGLNFEVYTIDAITPAGGIDLQITIEDAEHTKIAMDAEESSLPGISKWTAVFDVSVLGEDKMEIDYVNSEGQAALGLLGSDSIPWRHVDGSRLSRPWDTIDPSEGVYLYRETIRHWENHVSGSTVAVKGSLQDEDGTSLSGFRFRAIPMRQAGVESIGVGGVSEWIDSHAIDVSIAHLHATGQETDIPSNELMISVRKDFYIPFQTTVPYAQLYDSNQLDLESVSLFINRVIEFDWAFSETGDFSSADEYQSGTAHSIRAADFEDADLADFFFQSLADDYLADSLNGYYFDDAQEVGIVVHPAIQEELRFFIAATHAAGDFTYLESNGSFPVETYLTGDQLEWHSAMFFQEGSVFGVRSSVGYGMLRITGIDAMTQEDIQALYEDYDAQ